MQGAGSYDTANVKRNRLRLWTPQADERRTDPLVGTLGALATRGGAGPRRPRVRPVKCIRGASLSVVARASDHIAARSSHSRCLLVASKRSVVLNFS
jgi:hypothetical protein